ncbi:LemA family protein [archaeon]|jgi:LemA protein|nr:LemA family protein [archaeon]MBT6955867.1 LemA family protein [archaeon]MBT7128570.1 LemA family protein [archaeon]
MIIWISATLAIIIAITFLIYYNRFVTLSHQIDNALSQIDVQLRKRADLIPNLLSAVKGYMKHERAAIKEVTDARKAMMSAKGTEKKMKAGNQMQEALKSIFAIAEGYPDLKANTNFLQLQQELSAIEDKVAYARQFYNDGIMTYNVMTHKVPGIWFASIYGFKPKEYLKIPEAAKAVPKVEF